jgi:hypothetical protein
MDAIDARTPAAAAAELDYDTFDPRIRATVRWMRRNGFTVAHAGVTEADSDGEHPIPYVSCTVTPPEMLVDEARRMATIVSDVPFSPAYEVAVVSASFDHRTDTAHLSLLNIHDGMLPWLC